MEKEVAEDKILFVLDIALKASLAQPSGRSFYMGGCGYYPES